MAFRLDLWWRYGQYQIKSSALSANDLDFSGLEDMSTMICSTCTASCAQGTLIS
jgi:hypothetical protein